MYTLSGEVHPERKMHTLVKDHKCPTHIWLVHKCTAKSGGVRSGGAVNVEVLQVRVSHCANSLGKRTSLSLALLRPLGSTQRCRTGHRLHAAAAVCVCVGLTKQMQMEVYKRLHLVPWVY